MAAALAACVLCSACGQKGPLYLPQPTDKPPSSGVGAAKNS
ncbi:MAG TPA: lipoprotein [Burkholderiaceae bacterium]|nr:lipoprotein [Burkholderiaceae bacterium]